MVKYRIVLGVNIKGTFPIFQIVNLFLACCINCNLTVFINANIKCKLKGDVAAKDPDDLCMAGVCMETEEEICIINTDRLTLVDKLV